MRKKIFFAFLLTALAGGFALYAQAAGPLGAATDKLNAAISPTGLQSDITVSIGTVVRGVLAISGTIFLILTVYAGILWMTAQGEAEKISKAQQIVSSAIIGLAITMAAYAITTFVTSRVNTGGNTQTDYAAQCAALKSGRCTDAVANCGNGSLSQTMGGSCPVCCYSP